MLNVLLPMTLPTAMSRSPRTAAMIDAAISGMDVPDGDDREPDDEVADAEGARERHRGVHQPVEPSTSRPSPTTISSACTAQWLSHAAGRGTRRPAYSSRSLRGFGARLAHEEVM